MSVATAADKLKAADQALAAAKVIRDQCHEDWSPLASTPAGA